MIGFADDIVVLTESKQDFKSKMKNIGVGFYNTYNTRINITKPKVMVCDRNEGTTSSLGIIYGMLEAVK